MQSVDGSNSSWHIHALDIHISWGEEKNDIFNIWWQCIFTLWRRFVNVNVHHCSMLVAFLHDIIPGNCTEIISRNRAEWTMTFKTMMLSSTSVEISPDLLVPGGFAFCRWIKHVWEHKALSGDRWHCWKKNILQWLEKAVTLYLLLLLAVQC